MKVYRYENFATKPNVWGNIWNGMKAVGSGIAGAAGTLSSIAYPMMTLLPMAQGMIGNIRQMRAEDRAEAEAEKQRASQPQPPTPMAPQGTLPVAQQPTIPVPPGASPVPSAQPQRFGEPKPEAQAVANEAELAALQAKATAYDKIMEMKEKKEDKKEGKKSTNKKEV